MPGPSDWQPEDGDDTWWPEPGSTFTDTQLRFTPLFRRVQGIGRQAGIELSDADTLAHARTMLANYHADDVPEPEPEHTPPLLRLVP